MLQHALLDQVELTLRQQQLLPPAGIIYIAISGGADSLALLMAMLRLGYGARLVALHCNFRLRGAESEGDQRFVEELCRRLGVALRITAFDTERYAQEQGISIEMAARELRYHWFAEQRAAEPAPSVVAVAHNADDQVETLLLNLSMGTGIRGLSGMPYHKVEEGIIRPLMDCPRTLILDYLAAEGQDYRTDSSNADTRYKRNLIRHRLIPLLEQLNPSFAEAATRTIAHLRASECYYLERVEQLRQHVMQPQGIHIARLLEQQYPETLLYELLRPYGFSPETVRGVMAQLHAGHAGARFDSPTHQLLRGQTYLELRPRVQPPEEAYQQELSIEEAGECALPSGQCLSWQIEPRPRDLGQLFPLAEGEAAFDYEALGVERLVLRHRREGDVLCPYGMKGKKLLRRIFIDGKFAPAERRAALLLCRGDEVLWLVGHLADRRYRVTEHTQRILFLRLSPAVR
ncbi:tRNA lysidine(34) synthetase TilS [Porphyromonas sp.]